MKKCYLLKTGTAVGDKLPGQGDKSYLRHLYAGIRRFGLEEPHIFLCHAFPNTPARAFNEKWHYIARDKYRLL